MDILTRETVRLAARATDRDSAIEQAGELLVRAGYVAAAYVAGMLARERAVSTYLGNGVAIPHGELRDLALVKHTGLSVVQVPEGVEWDPGEPVFLVLGLAATSDDHTGILANVVEILQDPAAIQRLAHTSDPTDIVERLTRGASHGENGG